MQACGENPPPWAAMDSVNGALPADKPRPQVGQNGQTLILLVVDICVDYE